MRLKKGLVAANTEHVIAKEALSYTYTVHKVKQDHWGKTDADWNIED